MRYHITPFGCQMNRSDAERVKSVLESAGLHEAAEENHPEVIIKGIMSCSVRQKAIDRVYGKIRQWNEAKKRKPVITFLSGCILPADEPRFLKLFDIILPIEKVPQLPDMILQYGVPGPASLLSLSGHASHSVQPPGTSGKTIRSSESGEIHTQSDSPTRPDFISVNITDPKQLSRSLRAKPLPLSDISAPAGRIEDFWKLQPNYGSRTEAFIPIQNGCDKFCTFCAVPYTRGREVSRPGGQILDELRRLVLADCKSVTLLGQNVNSYGQDKPGEELDFPTLLEEAGKIGLQTGKEFWLYFTSPHPRDFNERLLGVMALYPVIANWVHLPLQSGDDKVLMHMNRNHSMDSYRQRVREIRTILPKATLFTDLIVGFSGETEEQFENTARAMREFCYDMAYIARYSPRAGARSARWADDVSPDEKSRRFEHLSQILQEKAHENRRKNLGQVQRILITGRNRNGLYLKGYNEGRVPIRLTGQGRAGEFVNAEITEVRPLSMQAAIVDSRGPGGAVS